MDPGTSSATRPRWCANVWLRAGVLHPLLFVAPWVLLCHLLAARSGSDVLLLGLVVSGVALVLGLLEWADAANVACHGTYECPF